MLLESVRAHFAPAGICVTDETPPSVDYDMLVVTSDTFQDEPNALALVHLDCGNTELNNVNVIFLSAQAMLAPATRAIAISKIAAAQYGLEDVDDPQDIMHQFPGNASNGAMFTEACVLLANAQQCEADSACAGGQQSALTRLMAI